MTESEPIDVLAAANSHHKVRLISLIDVMPDTFGGLLRESVPSDGHVGDGTKSLGGETTIHMNVGNVHLGKGLLKDGKPPCSILRFLGG